MSLVDRLEAAGVVYYEDPETVSRDELDPLIADAVLRVNESGWVWTTESCQGHPDADHPSVWAGNTDPYLRLVCEVHRAGNLMEYLFRAGAETEAAFAEEGVFWSGPQWKLSVGWLNKGGWFELYCYIQARTAWQRDAGIRVFETFADLVTSSATQGEEVA